MKAVLIHLDERMAQALDRVAPVAKRHRASFIRQALIKAIMEAENRITEQAYLRVPDRSDDADDWANAEEFRR